MTSHYEILGVGKKATADQIKAAARKARSAAHPDRQGGSHELMVQVNKAVDTLLDDKQRAHYDATGEDGAPMKDARARGLDVILSAFHSAVLTDCDDPVAKMKADVKGLIRMEADRLKGARYRLAEVAKRRRKIKFNGASEDNALVRVIDQLLQQIRRDIDTYDENLETLNQAHALASDYDFDKPPPSPEYKLASFLSVEMMNAAAKKFWENG